MADIPERYKNDKLRYLVHLVDRVSRERVYPDQKGDEVYKKIETMRIDDAIDYCYKLLKQADSEP